MILYRSIGEKELNKLLREVTVRGMYDCHTEGQNSVSCDNVVCCFTDKFRWKDKDHLFFLTLEIPEEDCIFGKGHYWISKQAIKEKVWTGREGSENFEIKEAYIDHYGIQNVKEIDGLDHYAKWYIEEQIKPIAKKYNIKV